jgi:hypothetical protein
MTIHIYIYIYILYIYIYICMFTVYCIPSPVSHASNIRYVQQNLVIRPYYFCSMYVQIAFQWGLFSKNFPNLFKHEPDVYHFIQSSDYVLAVYFWQTICCQLYCSSCDPIFKRKATFYVSPHLFPCLLQYYELYVP